MTERRRMPRPAPSWTRMPSSSGPRWMIRSHISRTTASVMLLSRVALTTPAIPHIRTRRSFLRSFRLSFHSGRNRIRFFGRCGHILETLEAVVAIVAGISIFTIASSQSDVRHLPGGYKMQSFFSLVRATYQLLKKLPEGISDHDVLLKRIHAVAVQLDEQPIRTARDPDFCLLPQRQPVKTHRVRLRNCSGLQRG